MMFQQIQASPGTKAWTNECVYKGIAYSPTIEYNSTIYYILYKSKNDPGVQLKGLSVKQIESMIQEQGDVISARVI